jgi:hypothetical protein
MTQTPDLLRWQVIPNLAVALEGDDRIVLDVAGQRTPVPNVNALAEALRQAHVQQTRDGAATSPWQRSQDARLEMLTSFVQAVAQNSIVADDFTEGNEVFNELVTDARKVAEDLGIDYEPGEMVGLDQPEPEPRFRWNDHRNERGEGCRWSKCAVSDELAGSGDTRCPFGCTGSAIEPIPDTELARYR